MTISNWSNGVHARGRCPRSGDGWYAMSWWPTVLDRLRFESLKAWHSPCAGIDFPPFRLARFVLQPATTANCFNGQNVSLLLRSFFQSTI